MASAVGDAAAMGVQVGVWRRGAAAHSQAAALPFVLSAHYSHKDRGRRSRASRTFQSHACPAIWPCSGSMMGACCGRCWSSAAVKWVAASLPVVGRGVNALWQAGPALGGLPTSTDCSRDMHSHHHCVTRAISSLPHHSRDIIITASLPRVAATRYLLALCSPRALTWGWPFLSPPPAPFWRTTPPAASAPILRQPMCCWAAWRRAAA